MSGEKSRPYRGRPRSYKANGPAMQYFRERAGLTLEQLGERANVSYGQISRIETGVTLSPRFSTIDQIAEALGVERDDLLVYKSPPVPETPGLTEENLSKIEAKKREWDDKDRERAEGNSRDAGDRV